MPSPQPTQRSQASHVPQPVTQAPATHLIKKVRFGKIHADHLNLAQALGHIDALVARQGGGYVVTPNVDHVCLAQQHDALVDAYANASLSLVDGMPLLWLAWAIGHALPQKISGSDLVAPLMAHAARRGWGVYLLGGRSGIGERAAATLCKQHVGLHIVGMDSPEMGFESNAEKNAAVLQRLGRAAPQIVLVALGCPKQELWMARNARAFAPAVALGIGASLDFVAGEVRRAPVWMSRIGLEWVYRLVQEPRRMASRYLVRDRAIVGIALRALFSARQTRFFFAELKAPGARP